ncbi:MAG: 4-hydroxy-3-methylbut-2-en-1-yl diphosphate synthase [Candidatus Azobacteroides sp.]|nr:4-hydroxy-3-methylbut-2-en-1-yl diphosphate synthase [Candidatus Azobacteroides sp.]
MDYFNYKRRLSSPVKIGDTWMGGKYPVRLQSMANTSTMDTESSIEQCIRIIEAGGEYIRFTAQGVREAENLAYIRSGIRSRGYNTPLVADIHFNPKAAEAAAYTVEKVRINPGNFVDSIKTFQYFEYTEEEYQQELKKIRDRFIPFLNICKKNNTAIRIGVNHGSLSDRIMSRYGDTPMGMVESCLEFLRICNEEKFENVVISIKASNTVVMVETVRLLVYRMKEEQMAYPLHLGVTEAGDGEDGRIKSAVGIGTLLMDGIGDTIRVSLSEDPELEVPVAAKIVNYISEKENHPLILGNASKEFDIFQRKRRKTYAVKNIGGENVPVVISDDSSSDFNREGLLPDYIYIGKNSYQHQIGSIPLVIDYEYWQKDIPFNSYPVFTISQLSELKKTNSELCFLKISYPELTDNVLAFLKERKNVVFILQTNHCNGVGEQRAFFHALLNMDCEIPVIIGRSYYEDKQEDLQIKAAIDTGALFLDGFGDGLMITNKGNVSAEEIVNYSFGILQATRCRISKTEFISCPGCGRTLFNLQKTIARVKEKTSHLKGLKIGIMGCIVNGPGEMADADYGYVGAGKNKITLYKGKNCVSVNIPEEEAVEKLIDLIKQSGDWTED